MSVSTSESSLTLITTDNRENSRYRAMDYTPGLTYSSSTSHKYSWRDLWPRHDILPTRVWGQCQSHVPAHSDEGPVLHHIRPLLRVIDCPVQAVHQTCHFVLKHGLDSRFNSVSYGSVAAHAKLSLKDHLDMRGIQFYIVASNPDHLSHCCQPVRVPADPYTHTSWRGV